MGSSGLCGLRTKKIGLREENFKLKRINEDLKREILWMKAELDFRRFESQDPETENKRPKEEDNESALEWVQYIDERTGIPYYSNLNTRESSWEAPEKFVVHSSVLLYNNTPQKFQKAYNGRIQTHPPTPGVPLRTNESRCHDMYNTPQKMNQSDT